jgi:hypothetical protein
LCFTADNTKTKKATYIYLQFFQLDVGAPSDSHKFTGSFKNDLFHLIIIFLSLKSLSNHSTLLINIQKAHFFFSIFNPGNKKMAKIDGAL